jgi:hypothetical protein
MVSVARPLRASNQEITELEFHISPVWSSSRPQTGLGSEPTRSSSRRATSGSSLTSCGLATASSASAITPSRQRRTSWPGARVRPTGRQVALANVA